MKNYMFFGNLKIIKREIDKLIQMDPEKVDSILSNNHDWASDHIATAKDDIQEVSDFLINEVSKNAYLSQPFAKTFENFIVDK
jgi:hypothetical protein